MSKADFVIYHYQVDVADGSGIISAEQKFGMTQLNMLAENDEYLVVDNHTFSTIQKNSNRGSSDIYSVLNKPSISINCADRCWGNRIWFSLYSVKPVTPLYIRRAIEREIDRRFGYFTGKIDLSFITEKSHAA